jgi:hypothetical protein
MRTIIGDKASFGIEIDIKQYEPHLRGKSCLWMDGNQIGDFDDENILSPFLNSLMRITLKHQQLWLEELNGLNCKQLYDKISPFHDNPDVFFELTEEEKDEYVKYDVFIFQFGENFDQWVLHPIVRNNTCKFIWSFPSTHKKFKSGDNNLNCFDVPLTVVYQAYKDLCELIPGNYWPILVERI